MVEEGRLLRSGQSKGITLVFLETMTTIRTEGQRKHQEGSEEGEKLSVEREKKNSIK